MPPRFTYWTILAGGLPTAFRAAEREDLLPTFQRLRQKHPDAEMKWFARGRLWSSPAEAREALETRRDKESKGRDWRPGGAHRDPRQRYVDAKKARNAAQRQARFERRHGGGPDTPGDRATAPPHRPHGDPMRGPKGGFPKREFRREPAHGDRRQQPAHEERRREPAHDDRDRQRSQGARPQRKAWQPQRPGDGAGGWKREGRPREGERERFGAGRQREGRPQGDPLRAQIGGPGGRREGSRRPPHERQGSHRPRERPHGDPLRRNASGGTGRRDSRQPSEPRRDWRDRPKGGGWKDSRGGGQTDRAKGDRFGSRQGSGRDRRVPADRERDHDVRRSNAPGRKPFEGAPPPRGKAHGDPLSRGRNRQTGGFRGKGRPFHAPSFERRANDDEPEPGYPRGPNREPRPGEDPPPSPPPRPNEPAIIPPGPPERGRKGRR